MGATHTNDLVNVADFYQQQILPDLQAPGDEVRAAAFKASCSLVARGRARLASHHHTDLQDAPMPQNILVGHLSGSTS